MPRRAIILTDGFTDPHRAKTAVGVIRYRPEDVVAVLDRGVSGQTCQAVLGVGGELPVVGSLDAADGADTLLLGTAPPGGKLPEPWRPIILDAIARGFDIVSGLHEFLTNDPEFVEVARRHGARLVDVRKTNERDVASHEGIREGCLRLLTVANSTSCGKMVTSLEVARGLRRAGVDAKFVATGQTGIMIEGDGCPIDAVVGDFLAGAGENLVRANQHHEAIVVEGQGSLVHPRYSGVTLGLLHGVRPDGLILCYEMGRRTVTDMDQVALPPLARVREFNETAADFMHPCKTIGVAINGRGFADADVEAERDRIRAEFGLPVCDVWRHGPDELVDAALALKRELGK